jgi:hypothetical protein
MKIMARRSGGGLSAGLGAWAAAGLLLFSGCGLVVRADEPGSVIRFHRPARVGQVLACHVEAATEMKIHRVLADGREQAETESLRLELLGTMRVTAVTANGQAAAATFQVAAATAGMNGRAVSPDFAGQVVEIDFTRTPVCEFRIRGRDGEVSAEEVRLLSLVFRPAPAETLADWLGGERVVHVGERWPLAMGGLLSRLAGEGVAASSEQVTGTAFLRERKTVGGVDCWAVAVEAATRNVAGYEFSLAVELLLPVEERHGVLRVARRGREAIRKNPPEGEPLAVNLRELRVELQDTMTAEFLPQ